MEIGYFPGCSLHSTAQEFDLSVKAVCNLLDIHLQEIPDWNCCGASAAHETSEELGFALPYLDLVKAETASMETVLSPCPSCFSHLSETHEKVVGDSALGARLTEISGGKSYQGGISNQHVLDFFMNEVGLDAIKEKVKKPLEGLKVACYYGCLTRLPGVNMDSIEHPMMMDRIVEALGAEVVDWTHKTECCGASLSITRTEIALRLGREILEAVQHAQADCIAVVCPLCQSNLDARQSGINRKYGTSFSFPVVYMTQLMGIAMGVPGSQLGFDKHIVAPSILNRY